eukprot:gnl/TRDRNA2_/TRDRNA2_182132_c0_seq1.p1 gnl/TRDRNA2_/TRDRNA2_182132_c0~~gnl/TRDRNA2_/TRDRNA2_182132_c0_seq1.p1  ORF type:complete len:154 (-),score=41.16 gnl/TRDRNA2_/TRDRNA2_182132_c0_seq1:66-527(-)
MMSCRVVLLIAALAVCEASRLRRLPEDVGDGKGADHPCVAVMRETQDACSGISFGESNDACNFATCYTADLNRDRCTDIVTDGTPKNVLFGDQLDDIKKKHEVKCSDGGIGGKGIRNARFDCDSVPEDGLVSFIEKYPHSAASADLKACLHKK